MKTKSEYAVYFLIAVLIIIPWFNSDSKQIDYIPELSQEANPFYEINPCKISLVEFFNANKKSIFQDHYFFRPNNDSSINCFGRITGIAVQQNNLQTEFFISVGTNSLINLLLQGVIWLLLLFLVMKSKTKTETLNKYIHNLSIILTSYLFTFSIYAQQRFYEDSFYIVDLNERTTYILIFLLFLFLIKNLTELYLVRSTHLINMLPLIFLIFGIFSGYNIVFFSFIFIYSGINSLILKEYNKKFVFTYLSFSFWWLINSNGNFYFNPGKFRGFTNSQYEFNSNLFWIIFFLLTILGILRELRINYKYFQLQTFNKYFSISSLVILIFGIVGSNFPSINFFSYYYLGLQRNVVELVNPFAFDQFGVKISWRGISPSSETIGEFFGLCLIMILFGIFQNYKLNKYTYIGIFSSSVGLYFSDNRTSIVIVFMIILFFTIKDIQSEFIKNILKIKKLKLFLSIALIAIFYLFTRTETYEFYSISILSNSRNYQFDSIFSSYLLLLNNSFEEQNILYYVFGFFSVVGYLLNRSEMWGIFFARYNPTFNELLIGSGPLTLGQLYGELKIDNLSTFLLPHSSLLSYIVYFGLLPVVYLIIKLLNLMIKNKNNIHFISISSFMFFNIIKNDSLNYFPLFLLYLCLIFIFSKLNFTSQHKHFFFEDSKQQN